MGLDGARISAWEIYGQSYGCIVYEPDDDQLKYVEKKRLSEIALITTMLFLFTLFSGALVFLSNLFLYFPSQNDRLSFEEISFMIIPLTISLIMFFAAVAMLKVIPMILSIPAEFKMKYLVSEYNKKYGKSCKGRPADIDSGLL